jgi:hypothetical protein
VLSAAASVAFSAQCSAMFAGKIGINDIKEQKRTLREHAVIVKRGGGFLTSDVVANVAKICAVTAISVIYYSVNFIFDPLP